MKKIITYVMIFTMLITTAAVSMADFAGNDYGTCHGGSGIGGGEKAEQKTGDIDSKLQ